MVRKVQARALWVRILTARIETGEPNRDVGEPFGTAWGQVTCLTPVATANGVSAEVATPTKI